MAAHPASPRWHTAVAVACGGNWREEGGAVGAAIPVPLDPHAWPRGSTPLACSVREKCGDEGAVFADGATVFLWPLAAAGEDNGDLLVCPPCFWRLVQGWGLGSAPPLDPPGTPLPPSFFAIVPPPPNDGVVLSLTAPPPTRVVLSPALEPSEWPSAVRSPSSLVLFARPPPPPPRTRIRRKPTLELLHAILQAETAAANEALSWLPAVPNNTLQTGTPFTVAGLQAWADAHAAEWDAAFPKHPSFKNARATLYKFFHKVPGQRNVWVRSGFAPESTRDDLARVRHKPAIAAAVRRAARARAPAPPTPPLALPPSVASSLPRRTSTRSTFTYADIAAAVATATPRLDALVAGTASTPLRDRLFASGTLEPVDGRTMEAAWGVAGTEPRCGLGDLIESELVAVRAALAPFVAASAALAGADDHVRNAFATAVLPQAIAFHLLLGPGGVYAAEVEAGELTPEFVLNSSKWVTETRSPLGPPAGASAPEVAAQSAEDAGRRRRRRSSDTNELPPAKRTTPGRRRSARLQTTPGRRRSARLSDLSS